MLRAGKGLDQEHRYSNLAVYENTEDGSSSQMNYVSISRQYGPLSALFKSCPGTMFNGIKMYQIPKNKSNKRLQDSLLPKTMKHYTRKLK